LEEFCLFFNKRLMNCYFFHKLHSVFNQKVIMNKLNSYIFLAFIILLQPLTADVCGFLPVSGSAGLSYDFFRSVPDGSWDGNTGGLASVNLSFDGSCFNCNSLGMQLGSSYGIYDWSGRNSSEYSKLKRKQQQGFLTGGIFRKTECDTGCNLGLVCDWMVNRNFGVFALSCSLAQLRFQAGYLCRNSNEFGFWGTASVYTSHNNSEGIDVDFRAINQINFFWEREYCNTARTKLWAGVPYNDSLLYSSGRAGEYILGASFDVPLTCRLHIDGHAVYMHGHSAPTGFQSLNYAANVCIGINYSFGNECKRNTPYQPLGNNSNFLVDTSVNY
jgi:Family of unknown function (DUF6666)